MTDIETSNSLADLAARIRSEHEAVATALKESVRHAIAAGELLLEAKDAVQHGQWLPWLRDHCTISERTAQLYIRVAKNRTAIEEQIRNGVADLSLNEAAAMLMLTSDMNKLIHFMREAESLSGEELIERCIAQGYTVIQDDGYDMFANRSDAEILEWHLFTAFLSYDGDAGRGGMEPKNTCLHVEWILQRPFQNVAEWLGEEGDKFRGRFHNGGSSMSAQFKADWAAFLDQHRGCTLADAEEKLKHLQREFEQAREEGRIQCDASSRRGAGKSKPTKTRRKRCTTN